MVGRVGPFVKAGEAMDMHFDDECLRVFAKAPAVVELRVDGPLVKDLYIGNTRVRLGFLFGSDVDMNLGNAVVFQANKCPLGFSSSFPTTNSSSGGEARISCQGKPPVIVSVRVVDFPDENDGSFDPESPLLSGAMALMVVSGPEGEVDGAFGAVSVVSCNGLDPLP